MAGIRQYIISVTAAAVFCGILTGMVPKKEASGIVLRLVAGIFLAFTAIRPLAQVRLDELPVISADYIAHAQAVSAEGEKISADALADIIKQQTEAYILDKAQSLNAVLTVNVTVSDDELPIPLEVRLKGAISPYAKSRLQSILEEDLGISKENQIWIG